jgi:peptide/nickel transport system permease protein
LAGVVGADGLNDQSDRPHPYPKHFKPGVFSMLAMYALRRLLQAIPVLLIVSFITFSLMYIVPGDPARVMLGDSASADQIAALHHQLGLDRPFWEQYFVWLGNVLRGNLGRSPILAESVSHVVLERAAVSFTLAIAAEIVAVIVGIGAGVFAAVTRYRAVDRAISITSAAGVAMPNFVVAIVLVVVFAVRLKWFPATGFVSFWSDPARSLQMMALPVIALAAKQAAELARMMRSSMLDVLASDYLLAARARNLGGVRTLLRHALPNALGPTITLIGVGFGSLVSGVLVVEVIFAIPGLGSAVVNGVHTRDLVLLQGLMFAITSVYILATLLADIAHAWINPRVKVE